ncbi:MAG: methyltransferase domain-containing protein [Chloroflexi bacterium]|nr:methyltransferase domain-containing protein [Chloroflexota bacterium]MDA1002759.1 methyltransferase domain-containing protein [Chloroflexota bacterium]
MTPPPGALPNNALRPTADEALAAWRDLILANREQIERLREDERRSDFYARRAPQFQPGAIESPELEFVRALAQPGDTLLDIGAGGGRFAVPLAPHFASVAAVEPSPAMRETLAAAAADRGVTNISVHDLRWPASDGTALPSGDVSLVAHVLYDIDGLGPFLDALEAQTRRTCVVLLGDRAPSTAVERAWRGVHHEPLHALPALREFLAVLGARQRRFDVRTFDARGGGAEPLPFDQAHAMARRLCWLAEGSEKDVRLGALLREHFGTADGTIALPPRLAFTALVTWLPPAA